MDATAHRSPPASPIDDADAADRARATLRVALWSDHFFHRTPLGLGRYAHELRAHLHRLAGPEVVVRPVSAWSNLSPVALSELRGSTGATMLPGGRPLWMLGWHLLGWPRIEDLIGPADVLHIASPTHVVPTSLPIVATVHDLGLLTRPTYFSGSRPRFLRSLLRYLERSRAAVICVSAFAADEVSRETALRDVEVIHEGVAEVFTRPPEPAAAASVMRETAIDRPFFLVVGSINPRKNLERVCRAFLSITDRVPHDLLLVGARGWEDSPVFDLVDDPANRGRIRFLGFVPDCDLACLYARADAFVFPSLYEGFGLPAVEAMASGCPVIASRGTALEEIGGGAALLVDPVSVDDIAAAMLALAESPQRRLELADRGRERSAAFSWRRAAEATREVYRRIAARA
jgi:glycosyltransferase involved in cell wall biosynthesis